MRGCIRHKTIHELSFSSLSLGDTLNNKRLIRHTDFQPSGSKHAVILVLIPGNGPGSRVIFPPASLMASAVLYTSSVPTAICKFV